MKIPIIVLNYNSYDDCLKCAASLVGQTGVETELVFVDNRSADGERLKAFCQDHGYTFIAAEENRGYNAGNNIGLRYAAEQGYKYALIANPDMEFPQPDYLARLMAKMEEDEDIVVCGSDVVTPEGIHQSPMYRDGDWRSSMGWFTGLFKKKKPDTYDFIDNYKESHYCSKVSGCCLMVRMDFLQNINFFDENVFLYCEEAILSRQVEALGKKMYYLADVQAVHVHIEKAKTNPLGRVETWKNSRIYFIKTYSGDSAFGKQVAIASLRLYMAFLKLVKRIKK